jgi:tRNA-specific 2-thiouridylase
MDHLDGSSIPPKGTLAVVAMSGGVDSATAAGLLAEAGCQVVGMTMRLYDARGTTAGSGRCCGPRDIEDARAVCAHLDIPHYVLDFEEQFARTVVDDFIEAYLEGETPNPCVRCNQHIKFTPLWQRAQQVGAGALVTGHYAQVVRDDEGASLHRAVDADKDQSYFLFSLPRAAASSVWMPLGGMTKGQVREHARRLGLPNAGKDESQEICFVPDGDHAGFVAAAALRRGRPAPGAGKIVTAGGEEVGEHDGVHLFTVGQHRGLGNLRTSERMYVVALDAATQRVTVGPRHLAETRHLAVRDVLWWSSPGDLESVTVQVRHRGQPIACRARASVRGVEVDLEQAVVAAPGQAAVFYRGTRVIAGGWVTREQTVLGLSEIGLRR